ncbi:mannose-1-phosphate guanylyltransferase [Aeoliella mucimassa]|uniref:mannose-1-phosphate guanylyltransferase n=1 Tax=Aeoliella mucimassa TaxID=2527972 RepID=A0A518AJ61_9BACT|nr:mannose-1-phosphate guanylyltransferase [Aeoliella mucimassa]QDU54714.1 Mannose-1-phosphate guanylyltransferase [Aeoliella mucimassa]
MLHPIIMAGGSGTRFWPASRRQTPKQMLSLVPGGTMIAQTVERLGDLAPPERCLVVTNERLVDGIRELLPQLPASAVVGEPAKRDTAPCIGLAALLVTKVAGDADAIMAVMPADHVITPVDAFQTAIRQAVDLIESNPQAIVTYGIKPTYPAEIFGYIHRDVPMSLSTSEEIAPSYHVKEFREKPNAATAEDYVESGEYYWNSGIFVWRASTILEALAEHQPQMLAHLEKIADAWGTDQQQEVFEREFTAIEGISIDYAVMEHATDVVVIEAPFEWDDLGGWQSLSRRLGTDDDGNTIVGKHLGLDTTGTIVRSSDDHLIVTLGLEDCIVVHTPDATLVANKHHEESIRKIVKELESKAMDEHL